MSTYGLTPTGLVIPATKDILAKIQADQLATVDPALNQDPTEPLGQFNGIFANKLATAYEILDTIYEGFDPDKSEGDQLASNAALTGVTKIPATYSVVTCSATLASLFSAAPGTMTASVAGQPGITFVNRDQVTIPGAAGPYRLVFRASVTGPVAANSGTLTVIAIPVPGWTAITNTSDAVLGTVVETDTALKLRRVAELTKGGSCGVDSIRAALLAPALVPGIISAVVLENVTNLVDANGLPPHSFCAVIWDGATPAAVDLTIANTIWANKPSGIQPFGLTAFAITDSNGGAQTVSFTRVTQKAVYFVLTVTKNSLFPADGIIEVQNAIIARGAQLTSGQGVTALAFKGAALTVPGVLDVTAFTLDFIPAPTNTSNLAITPFQIATFSTLNISAPARRGRCLSGGCR